MTKLEKQELSRKVRLYVGEGKSDEYIFNELILLAFKKETIRKYIGSFRLSKRKLNKLIHSEKLFNKIFNHANIE